MVGEMIQSIRETEKKAEETIRSAEEKSRETAENAKQQARSAAEQIIKNASLQAEEVIRLAKTQGERTEAQELARTQEKAESMKAAALGREKEAVDLVISLLA